MGIAKTNNHFHRIPKRRIQQRAHDLSGHGRQLLRCIAQQHRQRQNAEHTRGEHQGTPHSIMATQDPNWDKDQQRKYRAAGHEILQAPPLPADVLGMPGDLGVRSEEDRLLVSLVRVISSAAPEESGC